MIQAQMATFLRSQDGTLLKGDTAIQQRWREHFEQLLNCESIVTDDTILSIPQHPERASRDIPPTRKKLAQVFLNRLLPLTEEILPETQCGFRLSQGTTDMIFLAGQIQEKCREQNQELFMAFIDLTKAFEYINREALWKVLSRFGCPATFITIPGFNLGSWKSGPMVHPGCKRGPFLDNIAPMVRHASDWLQINYSTSGTPPSSHPLKKATLSQPFLPDLHICR